MNENALDEARVLHRAGHLAAAEPIYRRVLAAEPDNSEALHLLGVVALQRGDRERAAELIGRAIAAKPGEAKYHNNLGNALMAGGGGAVGRAEAAFRRATELAPSFAEAHFNLGVARHAGGRGDEAADAYRRALALDADHFGALNNLGRMLRLKGETAEAADLLRRAVALRPDSVDTAATLAVALEAVDALDEARAVTESVLAKNPEHRTANLVAAILDRRAGRIEQSRATLEALLATSPHPAIAASAAFHLGHACDRLGEADAAFAAFTRGNALGAQLPEAEGARPERYMERLGRNRDYFTRDRVAGWERAGGGRPAPVFFVGFPRSGTTLMEAMLGAHPGLATTAERSPLREVRRRLIERHGRADYPACVGAMAAGDVDEARGWFWDHAESVLGAAPDRRLVDKLPLNIVELGLAARLFADAPVVAALRDPRDVVLSCFMQEFALNDAMAHFATLDGAARLYAAVMGLWLRYREDLGLRCLEYRYEDLVSHPKQTARSVIEFIGETWTDEVLGYRTAGAGRPIDTPSREAVGEPLSARAIGRWRAYAAHLEPVLALLDPFVRTFRYEP